MTATAALETLGAVLEGRRRWQVIYRRASTEHAGYIHAAFPGPTAAAAEAAAREQLGPDVEVVAVL